MVMPTKRTLMKVMNANSCMSTKLFNKCLPYLERIPFDSDRPIEQAYIFLCLVVDALDKAEEDTKHKEFEYECEEFLIQTIALRDRVSALVLVSDMNEKADHETLS